MYTYPGINHGAIDRIHTVRAHSVHILKQVTSRRHRYRHADEIRELSTLHNVIAVVTSRQRDLAECEVELRAWFAEEPSGDCGDFVPAFGFFVGELVDVDVGVAHLCVCVCMYVCMYVFLRTRPQ